MPMWLGFYTVGSSILLFVFYLWLKIIVQLINFMSGLQFTIYSYTTNTNSETDQERLLKNLSKEPTLMILVKQKHINRTTRKQTKNKLFDVS